MFFEHAQPIGAGYHGMPLGKQVFNLVFEEWKRIQNALLGVFCTLNIGVCGPGCFGCRPNQAQRQAPP